MASAGSSRRRTPPSLEDRRRNLTLSRIYYDTDALVKGLIEVLPEIQSHPHFISQQSAVKDEIPYARAILEWWNPDYLKVSMYSLMETLNVGFRTYQLPLDRLVVLLTDAWGTYFTPLFPEFELVGREGSIAAVLEERMPNSTLYSQTRVRGKVVNGEGHELGTRTWGGAMWSGGNIATYFSGGPEQQQGRVAEVSSHSVSAPKFERELFLRALEQAYGMRIAPKDAIHVVYAEGNAELIVTTDAELLEALRRKSKRFPRGIRPSELHTRYKEKLFDTDV